MKNAQEISDTLEINDVIQRYGKALDEKQFDLLDKVFTKDAQLIYLLGEDLYKFTMENGVEFYKAFLCKCYWTCHLISITLIDFKGDGASTSSRVTATHIQKREDGSQNIWIVSGAYQDEFVRGSDGWLISKRIANAPYVEGDFLTEGVREFKSPPPINDIERS
jgi:SnoaL-like domain